MSPLELWYTLLASGVLLALVFFAYRRWRYRRAVRRPFPPSWRILLNDRLWFYRHLDAAQSAALERLILHFLYTKRFVGCVGQEVSEDMCVLIAAQACLLILGRPSRRFEGLRWIYLYPDDFIARRDVEDDAGVVFADEQHMEGESWDNGRVVLSWGAVEEDLAAADGRNVVIHEFAHQLDQEGGPADGAPLLYRSADYEPWSQVFLEEYQRLCAQLERGEETLIDPYGATHPAEFFAVVTELFFGEPVAMYDRHPALFMQLEKYFRLDPRAWVAAASRSVNTATPSM